MRISDWSSDVCSSDLLKIEREALKKEDDEGAKRSLAALEEEIGKLEREYADLEEKWKAERASVAGSAGIKEELDRMRIALDRARRAGALPRLAALPYGKKTPKIVVSGKRVGVRGIVGGRRSIKER